MDKYVGNTGLTNQQYKAVHYYLLKNFGKASKCENPTCLRSSTRYEWAKRKGKAYECKRENFIQLCKQCHNNYDRTPVTQLRKSAAMLALGIKGEKHGMAKLTNIQAVNIRHMRGEVSNRKIAKMYGVTHGTINRIMSGKGYRVWNAS